MEALYLVEELVVQFMTVVKNVFVRGVQARFHTVLHHHAGPRWTLEFLHLHTNTRKKNTITMRAYGVRCSFCT